LTHGVIYDLLNRLEDDQTELLVLGNGKQEKPYLYIDDLIDAIDCIYKETNDKINYYNVAANSVTTVKEIVNILLNKLSLGATKIQYTGEDRGWVGDVPKFKYDLSKISNLHWQPTMSSNQAVALSIDKELQYRKKNS
jgi:Nucleoside-diphosphate-sugar epimerases